MREKYPIRIESCPIVECKMDVFCKFNVPNVAVIGLIYQAFQTLYKADGLEMLQLPVMNIPEEIRQTNSNLKNQANYSIKCVDGEVQIGLYGFSLALVLPYSGWSVHSMFIKKALNAILSTGIIGDVLNINVRYLDFFKANIFDNINLKVDFEGREFKAVNPIYKVQLVEGDLLHVLQITQGVHIENSVLNLNEDGSLIDLTTQLVSPKKTSILLDLGRCHDANKRLFFDLLKKDYIATLKPVYE
jgi:uncharacterized protein (TIGR04255 family)